MSHHGSDPFDDPKKLDAMKALREKLLDTSSFRGALGDFPEGKVSATDEGAVQFAIGVKDGKVIVDVHFEMMDDRTLWIGLSFPGRDEEVHVTVTANGDLSVLVHEA